MNITKINKLEHTPLNDGEIRKYLKGINIITYPELKNLKYFPFDKLGRLIIFFETQNKNVGHWLAVRKDEINKTITWFDPYGIYPDGDEKWVNKNVLKQLGEDGKFGFNILHNYFLDGYRIFYNNIDFQSKKDDIATCGRWCCCFLLMNTDINNFNKIINQLCKEYNLSNDELVSMIISKY